MCKHNRVKQLRREITELRGMVKELQGKVDGHVGHAIPSYYYNMYPYTYYKPDATWTSSITYTNMTGPTTYLSGNGGASSEG
jgi:hypothetical protein